METIFRILSKMILVLALVVIGVLSYYGIGVILTTLAVIAVVTGSVGCDYLADRYNKQQ